jgi:NADPH2:quinone reductase
VLITGASGGVATAAIQLADAVDARVLAITSAPYVEAVRSLGAERVYDRADPDFVRAIKKDTEGRGVDLIIDSVGEALWPACMRLLAVRGTLVCYGATTGPEVGLDLRHVFWTQLSIRGATMGSPAEFREALGFLFSGAAKPVIDDVLPLEGTREAHERLEAGGVFGKLVVRP